MEELIRIVLLFFIYAIIGWLWETFYCSLKAKKFVYRGFLVGPYCPIYGFGVLSVLYFIEPYQNNVVVLFVLSATVVTILEYLTSFILEKLFHTTWWDYHHVLLNINGRVALPISLFWGLACVLIVKVVHPELLKLENFLAVKFGVILPILLIIMITADLIYTVTNMISFQKAMKKWSEAIESSKLEFVDKKEELSEEWKERKVLIGKELEDKVESLGNSKDEWLNSFSEKRKSLKDLPKINFNHRRMLKNFSQVKPKEVVNMDEVKKVLKQLYDREHSKK